MDNEKYYEIESFLSIDTRVEYSTEINSPVELSTEAS